MSLRLILALSIALPILVACGGTSSSATSTPVRKVVLLQGIDSSSTCPRPGDDETSFNVRRQGVVSLLAPLGARPEDVVSFSYSGSYQDCGTQQSVALQDVADGHATPAYDRPATCGGIERAAARLSGLVEAFDKEFPGVRLDFVAHSMGGLVVASYLAGQKPKFVSEHVHSVVLLDSPIRGLPPPRNPASACPEGDRSWRDMIEGSGLTAKAATAACRHRDVKFVSVLATSYIGDEIECGETVHTATYGHEAAGGTTDGTCGRLPPTVAALCAAIGAESFVLTSAQHSAVWQDANARDAIVRAYSTP